MKLTPFLLILALPLAACGGQGSADVGSDAPNATEAAQTKAFTFTCTEDKAREGKYDHNAFASLTLVLKGKTAKLEDIVYTNDFVTNENQEIANEQDFLSKGVDYDGKTPLTQADKDQANAAIANTQKILAANGHLELDGAIKPYVRKPKKPTVQYPLASKTSGVDESTLWDALGNEGNGARLLLPPDMSTGNPGKPDIEFEGSQGPVWDRYDCR